MQIYHGAGRLVGFQATTLAERDADELAEMIGRASFDHLVVADSGVVAPDYLRHLVPALLEPGVGCMTTVSRQTE